MSLIASQITSLTIVYSTVYSGEDRRKYEMFRFTGLCAGNLPVTGEFPAQMASNAHYDGCHYLSMLGLKLNHICKMTLGQDVFNQNYI